MNGDSESLATSGPLLYINTDAGVKAVFAGSMSDFEQGETFITKLGPGTQTFSGNNNTYSGLTTINEGTFVLNGTLLASMKGTPSVLVNSQGTLAGSGTIAGNLTNYGMISPGQSIGTMTVLGNYYNNNGGYFAEVNGAGDSDLIDVGGTAFLNGGLVLVGSPDGTYQFQHRYTIVDALAVSGVYSGVTAVLGSLIKPTLSYDASHVYLTLATDINSEAVTCNQHAIATLLDGISNPSTNENLVLSAIVSASDLPEALDSLSGYQYTNDLATTEFVNRQFIRRLYDPIRSIVTCEPNCCCNPCDCCDDGFSFWLESGGTYAQLDNSEFARGFNMNGYEITFGGQKSLGCDWTLGIAGSYEDDTYHYRHRDGSGSNKTWLGGLYGLYRPAEYYGLVDLAYGHSCNKMHRRLDLGNVDFSAHGKPDTSQFTFYGEVGVDYTLCNLLVQPFAGIEAGWYRRKHFTESNEDGIALNVDKRERSTASARLGLHVTTCTLSNCFNVSFDIAWDARLTSCKNNINAQFVGFGDAFEIEGTRLNRNSVDYALTFTSCVCEGWQVYLEGSGESWNKANLYNILGGVKFAW